MLQETFYPQCYKSILHSVKCYRRETNERKYQTVDNIGAY
jgi:hypothetical protein